jgi:hypothetical protein
MLSPHNSFKCACYSVILPIKVLVGRLTHLTDYGVESWHASSSCKSCTKGSRITWHCCMKLRVEPAHPQLKTLIIISLAWMVNNNCSSLSLFNTTLFSENLFNKECAFCVWGGEFDTQMLSLDVLRWCIGQRYSHQMFWGGAFNTERETEREIVTECPSDVFTTVDFMMFIDFAEMAIRKFWIQKLAICWERNLHKPMKVE